MRLFFGIDLPADVRSAVADVANRCRRGTERSAPRAILRWVPPENLHITLWFLGEVDGARANGLTSGLSSPLGSDSFQVQLKDLGTYPATGSPHVVWLGVAEGNAALFELHRELNERLRALGFRPDDRPYSPHVTLARVKRMRRSESAGIRSALGIPVAIPWFTASSVSLFRSRTLPSGSQYESLLRVPLR